MTGMFDQDPEGLLPILLVQVERPVLERASDCLPCAGRYM